MKRKQSVLLVISLLLIALFAFGCGKTADQGKTDNNTTNAPKAEKDIKIGLLMPSLEGYVYVAKTYGIVDQAQKLGVPQPVILAAGGYDKLEVQVKQVEDMIASKVDAIVIMPLSEDGMVPVLNKAVDAGIKVVEMGNISKSEKVQARVRSDQVKMGELLAQHIGKALNGQGNIVMFNGPAGASWSTLETNAFKKTMTEQFPGVKMLGDRWTAYDAGVAMTTMNDFMQSFDDIDYVYAAWDTYAEGAARAIEAAHKDNQIKISTVALSSVTLPLLKKGLVDYVIGASPVQEGRLALEAAVKLVKGEPVDAVTFDPMTEYTTEQAKGTLDTSFDFYPEGWQVPK